ncbi:MAG: hypothetical protein AB8H86_04430 [Polyangiales bacterium]
MTRFLLCAFLLVGCDCGQKTDEEILAERIDTSSVHLYVAAKVALTKTGDDPQILEARERITTLMAAFVATQNGEEGSTEELAEAAANTMSAAELLALASALYELRATGAEIVRSGSEDDLEPLLPVLLLGAGEGDSPLAQNMNISTDHAVFFAGLWVLKVHPRAPTPVPQEILLYEASRIDTEELLIPGLAVGIHGLRSYTYATNELCDLAKRDADALEAIRDASIEDLFVAFGGLPMSEEEQRNGIAGARALAHGATAYCFFGRDEPDEAREELEHFVQAAEDAGASPADLGLIRAYLAYNSDDLEEARRQLNLAKEADWLEDDYRADIDELIEHLDREDTDALDAFFDKAFFARFAAELVLREAEEAGLFDSLKETPAYRTVHGFLAATNQALAGGTEGAREAAEGAMDRAGGFLDKLRGN